jgi:cytochrome P450
MNDEPLTAETNFVDLGVLRAQDYVDRDSVEFLAGLIDRHGDRVRYTTSVGRFVVINHPTAVYELARNDNFRRLSFLQIVLGNGLLTSEGAWWRRQRQLAQPVFTPERVTGYGDLLTAQIVARIANWREHAGSGEPLDVADEMAQIALNVVVRALFGRDIAEPAVLDVLHGLRTLLADLSDLATTAFAAPQVMTAERQRAFRESIGTLERTVDDIVGHRRSMTTMPDDLLTRLLTSRNETTGELITDRQIRDEIVTLIVAGYETTSLTLDWAWYLLARHPRAEARLHAELDSVLNGRMPTVDDLPRLAWTSMIVKETLRLYPPVWYFNRRAQRADTIAGIPVVAGDFVAVCVYSVHRHPEYWGDANAFAPERFDEANADRRQLKGYLPFGVGRHQCLGMHLALMEATLVLAALAREFRVRPCSQSPAAMDPGLTLKIRGGLPSRIELREARGA